MFNTVAFYASLLASSNSGVISEKQGLLLFTPPAWLTDAWNTSNHTDEMLFMRQSEGEMLILSRFLTGRGHH